MSTLNVANVTDGTTSVPTGYVVNGSAKAWVNFNGTGTIATRDSFNLSSLTDNSTGQYDLNYSSSMANANYAGAADSTTQSDAATFRGGFSYPSNTSSVGNYRVGLSAGYTERTYHTIAVFGDLA